jgi:hypothetical protein
MKIKIQDIVYRANVREVREKIIRVADFAIPSDKIAASLATAAGQMLVALAAGSWDVLAAPGSDGLSLVSDTTLAKKIKWAASTAALNPILTNKSGGDLTAGSVVIKSPTASAFTTTTTIANKVIGVLGETIANNLPGAVYQVGLVTVLVQGNVAVGDQLCASATAGRAQTSADGQGVFALAMTAYAGGGAGSVTALVFAIERVPTATDAVAGKVELATVAETITGTDTGRAITPANLAAARKEVSAQFFLSAAGMSPQATNGCAALATTSMATNKEDLKTLNFDKDAVEYAQTVFFFMPSDYNGGTFTAKFAWIHPATTTNFGVTWQIEAAAFVDDLTGDSAWGTAVHVDDTGGTTNDIYISAATGAVTPSGSPAAGCGMMVRISRLATDGADTLAVDANLIGIQLTYTRN